MSQENRELAKKPDGAHSVEAWKAMCDSYSGLPEKAKRRILKDIHEHKSHWFDYWVSNLKLPKGVDLRKVARRDGVYGKLLDDHLLYKEGEFFHDVIVFFLRHEGYIKHFEHEVKGSDDRVKAEAELDVYGQKIASVNPYASLLVSYVKCFRDLTPALPVEDDVRRTLEKIRDSLVEYAGKFESWAGDIRLAKDVDKHVVTEALAAAGKDAADFHLLMSKLAKKCGITIKGWNTPGELQEQVDVVVKAVAESTSSSELAAFLSGLAQQIRALAISHRSTKEQERLRKLQVDAAGEIEQSAASKEPRWIGKGPASVEKWLPWAFNLGKMELDAVQSALVTGGYPCTSEFVGLGEMGWIPPPGGKIVVPDKECDPSDNIAPEPPPQPLPALGEKPAPPAGKVDRPLVSPVVQVPVAGDSSTTQPVSGKPEAPRAPVSTAPKASVGQDLPDVSAGDSVAPPVMIKSSPEYILEEDVKQVAAKVLADNGKRRQFLLSSLVWNLLKDKELSSAYICACMGEGESNSGFPVLPPWVIKSLILAPGAFYTQPEVVQTLQRCYAEVDVERLLPPIRAVAEPMALMLFSATVAPALFTPHTGGRRILESLSLKDLPSLHAITRAVINYADSGQPIALESLCVNASQGAVKAQVAELSKQASAWLGNARHYNFNYQPARVVWNRWLAEGGFIHNMLHPLIDQDHVAVSKLPDYLARLNIDDQIDSTYRKELHKREDLVGAARRMLIRHAEEALSLTRRGIASYASSPSVNSEQQDRLTVFTREFSQHVNAALSALRARSSRSDASLSVKVGVACAIDSLEFLQRCLKGQVKFGGGAISPELRLKDAVLRVPEIHLSADYSHELGVAEQSAFLKALGGGMMSHVASFTLHCDHGDHLSTRHILEVLASSGDRELDQAKLVRQRAESLARHKSEALEQIAGVRRALSSALAKGMLGESEYAEFAAQLDLHEAGLQQVEDAPFESFHSLRERLSSITASLDKGRNELIQQLTVRLQNVKVSQLQRERIQGLLEDGDVHLAADFIERIEGGGGLPEPERPEQGDAFLRFCGSPDQGTDGVYGSLFRWMEEQPGRELEIVNLVKQGHDFAGLNLSAIPADQRNDYVAALEKWFTLKRAKNMTHVDDMGIILRGLGFAGVEVKKDIRQEKTWLTVKTEVIDSRPVAHFGSAAQGRYTVLCIFSRLNEEQILQAFEHTPYPQAADIVLYFGRMPLAARRRFAALCRKRHKTMLLIDDVLMTFLAGVKESKIEALMQCGMPFTYFMPYSTTGSLLPREMFFGREREMRALESISNDSSCLLYGGRQIGKTVLLKHVERRIHAPSKGSIAKYIDLKNAAIGSARPLDDIWRLIMEELKDDAGGLLKDKMPAQAKAPWFVKAIKAWLESDPSRRILLLLDEADAFLDADGKTTKGQEPFSRCTQFKGLMEETHRRFKVVFAGLHNVQRATRVANNPLAHFGTPICIGPLYQNGEARAAQALIERPLACLGFFFESTDLVIRILAQTNYYPNLIQIYCFNLVHHMMERNAAMGGDRVPPSMITSEDIKDVYERQQLRDDLQHRFELTLNLDPRFRLLAYVLALFDKDQPVGFDIPWIRDAAQAFWAPGFEDRDESGLVRGMSHDDFRNLLDEMVGLGILRRTPAGDCYRLRSPNVVALLGSLQQISLVLEGSANWEKPPKYEQESFRRHINSEDRLRRSPLTALQEGELLRPANDVFVVAGSEAGGLCDVIPSLQYIVGQNCVSILPDSASRPEFLTRLSDLEGKRSSGFTVLVVGTGTGWDITWRNEARTSLTRLRKTDSYIKVIFLCGPRQCWDMLAASPGFDMNGVICVQPWKDTAVRQWCEDASLGVPDNDTRKKIQDITGYWPLLLGKLVDVCGKGLLTQECMRKVPEDVFLKQTERPSLFHAFGLDVEGCRKVLDVLVDKKSGAITDDEQQTLVGDDGSVLPLELVRLTLAWLDMLRLVTRGAGSWKLDAVVCRLLESELLEK